MLNNKFITAGIVVAIAVAIIYLGNLVMKTTPESGAGGAWQYEIIGPVECMGNLKYYDCIKQKLNEKGQEGWELILQEGTPSTYIFKKK